ncbi:hypothetical protein E2C01_084368 [Portunus trituberculatus]|uniref:Uncharacterized protein n=1 Tax=Portunus trituberculatus TaxID=210409 RepID=A0A5B7IZS4_PORTR|nr:hypothetical protein [Portunus trituberculatus]
MTSSGCGCIGSGQRMAHPQVEKQESEKSQQFTYLAQVRRFPEQHLYKAFVINLSIMNDDDLELTAQCPVNHLM